MIKLTSLSPADSWVVGEPHGDSHRVLGPLLSVQRLVAVQPASPALNVKGV